MSINPDHPPLPELPELTLMDPIKVPTRFRRLIYQRAIIVADVVAAELIHAGISGRNPASASVKVIEFPFLSTSCTSPAVAYIVHLPNGMPALSVLNVASSASAVMVCQFLACGTCGSVRCDEGFPTMAMS